MSRLADLWTEFRAGKPLRSVSAGVPYIRFSKDDPHYGGDCIYDEDECYDVYFGVETHWMDANDWELVPQPKQKKTVKMAPALCKGPTETYWLTDNIYVSEEQAKDNRGSCFVRWLIDTHSVTVEVEE